MSDTLNFLFNDYQLLDKTVKMYTKACASKMYTYKRIKLIRIRYQITQTNLITLTRSTSM